MIKNRAFYTNVPSGLIHNVPSQSIKYKDAATIKQPLTQFPFLSQSTGTSIRIEIKSIPTFAVVPKCEINNNAVIVDASRLKTSLNALLSSIQSIPEQENQDSSTVNEALLSVKPLLIKLHGLGLSIANIQNLLCGEMGVLIDEAELCEFIYDVELDESVNVNNIMQDIQR